MPHKNYFSYPALLCLLILFSLSACENRVCPTKETVLKATEATPPGKDVFEENPAWDQTLACKKTLLLSLFEPSAAEEATSQPTPAATEMVAEGRKGYIAFNKQLDKIVQPPQKNKKGYHFDTVKLTDTSGNKIDAAYLSAGENPKYTFLYLHGGGYLLNLSHVGNSYVSFLIHLSNQLDAQVYMPDYRVTPEAPLSASLDDAFESYKALLNKGIDPQSIIISGDSAGGGLALRLLLKIKAADLPMPGGGILISPWSDLTNSGDSIQRNAKKAVIAKKEELDLVTPTIVGEADPNDPLVSPIFGNYQGFPPLLYVVGGREIFEDDTLRDVQKAKTQGVSATVIRHEDGIHIYPVYNRFLPEANEAMEQIIAWVKAQLTN